MVANGILENATIVLSLKYLSNSWRSLQMPLINSKVELKLKSKKHCVLFTSGVENTNADLNNFVFAIKDIKLYIPVVILSAKDNQKISNFLPKDLKDQFIGMNVKQKKRIEIQQLSTDIFSN